MTTADTGLRRAYAIHGVGLEVTADDYDVIKAMELRFKSFPPNLGDDTTVRFEFVAQGQDRPAPPSGTGRPVYDTPHGSLHYFPATDVLYGALGGVHLECQASRGVAVLRGATFSGRDLYLATHPLATIGLMELLERRGLFSLHAACLAADRGRGVLLAGPSGSGKSTLSLALARAGMSFLSDDIVFLARDGEAGDVRVVGFADTVGVTPHAAEQFAELRPVLEEPPIEGFPKRLARIEELFDVPALPACEPAALVFPEVFPGEASRIAPLDGEDALLRLVPDVLLTDSASTKAHLEAIAALLRRVRCYALRSGNDLERAADLVRALV